MTSDDARRDIARAADTLRREQLLDELDAAEAAMSGAFNRLVESGLLPREDGSYAPRRKRDRRDIALSPQEGQ